MREILSNVERYPTGNHISAAESTGRQVNWTYDAIYRLTDESIANDPSNNDGSVSYTLDPVGNRTNESSALPHIPSGSWSFNADDEISGKSYDQNGNVTSLGGKSFTYNSQNQLIAMTASGTSFAMIYDGFGNRVAKTGNGATTQYLVEDDKNPTGVPQVFDELTNGVVTRTYAYGLQRIDEDQVIDGVSTPSYYGYDEGGSVRNLTGANGVVTDRYEYDAFGNSFTVSGATPNNYLYRGEQHDPDLGLYYLRTRYYNPLSGRFTGVDPLTDQGQPRYAYAGADPVNGIDPMGTEDMIECALLGANRLGCPFIFPVIAVAIPHPLPWCELSTQLGLGAILGNSPCKHLVLNQGPIKRKGVNNGYIDVLWTLMFNNGDRPGGNYYVTEQQSLHRLATNPSGSGRTTDYFNYFEDSVGTTQAEEPANSFQTFSISLSPPDPNGWSAGSMHVNVVMHGQEYYAAWLHLNAKEGGPGTTETGVCPVGGGSGTQGCPE